MRENDGQRKSDFDRRFDRSFRRVYSYVLRRVQDHATAQRITREVLVRSLPELVGADETELAATLLRAARRCLRSEASRVAGQSRT